MSIRGPSARVGGSSPVELLVGKTCLWHTHGIMVRRAVYERWKAADSGTLLMAPSTGERYGSDPSASLDVSASCV